MSQALSNLYSETLLNRGETTYTPLIKAVITYLAVSFAGRVGEFNAELWGITRILDNISPNKCSFDFPSTSFSKLKLLCTSSWLKSKEMKK